MSRLIDADWIVDSDIANCLGAEYYCCVPDVRDMLNEQPTAYDVEKVVEELENLREVELHKPDMCDELGNGDGESQYNDGRSQGRYEAFIEAIEIVKRGGRDESKMSNM